MQWKARTAAGAQWVQVFKLTNADGSIVDLTGLTWEFVIRPAVTDAAPTPLVKVTTTGTSQGQIVIDIPTGTITVTLTPSATALLGRDSRAHALWSNPGTTTAVCWVEGSFDSALVAAA